MRVPAFLGRSATAPPPSPAEIRRNDWVLFGAVIVLMTAGWLILRWYSRPQAVQPQSSQTADGQTGALALPAIRYPAGWLLEGESAGALFRAWDPSSPGAFAPSMEVVALTLEPGATLDAARAGLSLQRSRELERYRELSAEPVTVLGGEPAILVTYAWLADPTQESGGNGLPVVVQAQDLVFARGEAWMRATVAADAANFESDALDFDRFFASLDLKRSVE